MLKLANTEMKQMIAVSRTIEMLIPSTPRK